MRGVLRVWLVVGLLLAGCAGKPEQHSTNGVVQEISHGGKEVTIKHEDFPNFMEGMTMPFELADTGLAQGLKPGDKIHFTITRRSSGYQVTEIEKIK